MSGTIPTLTSFTSGDIVVSVVGDDNNSGTYADNAAAPIALEEIDPTTGSIVGEMVLSQTTTVNAAGVTEYGISGEYGSSSEGSLELAGNGESLVIAGYGVNAAAFDSDPISVYGTNALAQSSSVPDSGVVTVPRVIADISYNGTVDTSTELFNVFDLNNPRSVATENGSTFYISGQGDKTTPEQGVFAANDGSESATQITGAEDTRTVEIVNGELYVSYDSKEATPGGGGITNFGTTLPASETTGTQLTGIGPTVTLSAGDGNAINNSTGTVNLSPENFFFANADTLYIADGGQPKEGGAGDGGLQKWTYNTSTSSWQLDYTLTQGLGLVENNTADPADTDGSAGLIGMTAQDNSNGTVTFYVTNSTISDLDQTALYTITDTLADTTAAQVTGETFSTVISALDINGSPVENIRGVAFAPTDTTPVTSTTVTSGSSSSATVNSGSTLTVQAGGTLSGGTVLSAANVYVAGTDSATYIAEGGQEVVSGGTATSDSISGEQVVIAGGSASNETIFNNDGAFNGGLAVEAGGTASAITVNSGGVLIVSGGGAVSGLTINGGTVYVDTAADSAGGSIDFTGAGEIVLSAGGLAAGASISGFTVGDTIDLANIGSGATLTSATSGGNTVITVASGGVSENFTFAGTTYKAGYFELTGDPVLTVNPVVALNEIIISSGITSSGLNITSGQNLIVQSGGTVSATTIQAGGSASIYGTDSGTSILSGGVETETGTGINASVANGGSLTVLGAESNITIAAGASVTVLGFDSGTTIPVGATEIVSGFANGDAIYGVQNVSGVTAVVSGETVFSGGALELLTAGAAASAITVHSGGQVVMSGNVTVTNITLSGGTIIEESPKTVLSGTVDFAGSATLKLTSATTASAGSYGDQAVISGFGAGDKINLAFYATSGIGLSSATSGGNTEITVTNGGATPETFIFAGTGGTYGLTADVTSGLDIISGTGTITPSLVYTVSSGHTSSGLTVGSGYSLNVLSGGVVSAATILAGGVAVVSGTDSGTVISGGGSATIIGTQTSATILAGATENVSGTATGDLIYGTQTASAGNPTLNNETVENGGILNLFKSGATASNTTVEAGGYIYISGAGVAKNITVSGAQIELETGSSTVSGTLTLLGSGTTLSQVKSANAGAGYAATISGFSKGDIIDLGFVGNGATLSVTPSGGNTVVSVISGGVTEDSFTLSGSFTSGNFSLANVGGQEQISTNIPCFAAGTHIATTRGDIAVEALVVGDEVLLAQTSATAKITWLGHRGIDCTRHPRAKDVWPVLVRAGAFADNTPVRDLYLSPGHSIFVDGALIQAGKLINGATIVQVPVDHIEYWHVELETHAILLSENLPSESYLDTGNRTAFINGGAYLDIHPDFKPKHFAETCVPLVLDGEAITAAQTTLLARAAALGYTTTAEDDLHIIADGARIEPVTISPSRKVLMLPAGCQTVVLKSRTFVPAQRNPASRDTRSLGICAARLNLDGADVPLAGLPATGWHAYDTQAAHRWTKGETPLPANTRFVVIDLATSGHYWATQAPAAIAHPRFSLSK